jgi:hypothetical protein
MAIIAVVGCAALLAGCDPGSKNFTNDYYQIAFTVSQQPVTGAVVVTGTTDLPDGTPIDGLVTTSHAVATATDGAILNGSTTEPGAQPVLKGRFVLVINAPLPATCNNQPPCGPFAAGQYMLLIDVKTPPDNNGQINVAQDARYLGQTHGFGGFGGLEISQQVSLTSKVQLRVDENGVIATGPATPQPSPSASPVPT